MELLTDDIRTLSLFEDLTDEQLAWFCRRGEKIDLANGEHMFERGHPADYLFVVLDGTIEGYEPIGGQWLLIATHRRGQATGMLPFSRMTHYPRYTAARGKAAALRIPKVDFLDMLAVSPEVGQRLVALMTDRVRGDVRQEQQRERLMALGRLSAGLAHELNNPAAALRRAAECLPEQRAKMRTLMAAMVRHQGDESVLDAIDGLRVLAIERPAPELSALARSEREEHVGQWLEDHQVPTPWEIAATLVDSGIDSGDLERLAASIPAVLLPAAIACAESNMCADQIVGEISSAGGRISEVLASVKKYTHMDRSAEHSLTNVQEGLSSTLKMLGHRLNAKRIRLSLRYEDHLPEVMAHAGELNQVWTNLIENALDALEVGGELNITVSRAESVVRVAIADNGRGIPEADLPHVFEPFFTTKDVGEGTGLGLDIALRIVRNHQGSLELFSHDGRTEARVGLPVASEV